MASPGTERGTRFGQYRILESLGEGGMGEVCLAVDETLDRKVALKTIRAEHRLDPQLQARFLREARILSSLDHPGICRIYDYLRAEDRDVLVLEYIEGRPLGRIIAEGVEFRIAVELSAQLCDALATAHTAGVIHRDLKPANVLVDADGNARVLDFGLARSPALPQPSAEPDAPESSAPAAPQVGRAGTIIHLLEGCEPDTAELTLAGSILGTVAYMAPEQATGAPVTTATDCYSLGLVLQELFTGKPALAPAESLHEQLIAAALGEPRPIEGVDREVARLLRRLLRRSPPERATAQEALGVLRRIRTRARRRVRNGAVAGVVLLGVWGAWRYTVDLKEQRDAAAAARAVAEDRTRQAESLVESALSSMTAPLEAIDRLDVMRPFVGSVRAYFDAVDESALTDEERVHYAQLLTLTGSTEMKLGRRSEALASFEKARDLARSLTEAHPEDPDAWLRLGDAHFYVAGALELGGRFDEAVQHQRRYLEAAERQLELTPDDRFARTNVSWAHNAVGAALISIGDEEGAETAIARARDELQRLVDEDPGDAEAVASLADAVSWLGSAALERGDAEAAVEAFGRELELRTRIARDQGDEGRAGRLSSYARTHLIRALLEARRGEEALPHAEIAVAEARRGLERDPEDTDHKHHLFVALVDAGQVRRNSGDGEAAAAALTEATEVVGELLELDASNRTWQRSLVLVLVERAEQRLDRGEWERAEELLARGRRACAELLSTSEPTEEVQCLEVSIAVLQGQVHAHRGHEVRARAAWQAALAKLSALEENGASSARTRLEAACLLLLGRSEEAAPILHALEERSAIDARLQRIVDAGGASPGAASAGH